MQLMGVIAIYRSIAGQNARQAVYFINLLNAVAQANKSQIAAAAEQFPSQQHQPGKSTGCRIIRSAEVDYDAPMTCSQHRPVNPLRIGMRKAMGFWNNCKILSNHDAPSIETGNARAISLNIPGRFGSYPANINLTRILEAD